MKKNPFFKKRRDLSYHIIHTHIVHLPLNTRHHAPSSPCPFKFFLIETGNYLIRLVVKAPWAQRRPDAHPVQRNSLIHLHKQSSQTNKKCSLYLYQPHPSLRWRVLHASAQSLRAERAFGMNEVNIRCTTRCTCAEINCEMQVIALGNAGVGKTSLLYRLGSTNPIYSILFLLVDSHKLVRGCSTTSVWGHRSALSWKTRTQGTDGSHEYGNTKQHPSWFFLILQTKNNFAS